MSQDDAPVTRKDLKDLELRIDKKLAHVRHYIDSSRLF